MKSFKSLLLTGGVIALLGSGPLPAAENKPVEKDVPPAQSPSAAARPIPFRGTVDKWDAEAKTITVGKRVFQLTEETKMFLGDRPAKMTDIQPGEKVGGAYVKAAGDKLVAVTVRLGDKPPAEPKPKQTKEKKESE